MTTSYTSILPTSAQERCLNREFCHHTKQDLITTQPFTRGEKKILGVF